MTPLDPTVSRRALLVLFGVAAAAAGGAAVLGTSGERGAESGAPAAATRSGFVALPNNTPFGRWTVGEVGPMSMGAVTVTVVGESGETFALEVMARDESPDAPRAPGESKYFSVYIPNGGDGDRGTLESQGLAAMTLASIIERHETPEAVAPFLTLSRRLTVHAAKLGAPGSTAI